MNSAPTRPIEVPPFQLQPLVSELPPEPQQPPSTSNNGGASGEFDFLRSADGALSNFASASPLFSRVMGGNRGQASQPAGGDASRAAPAAPVPREVRCAQAYNKDLYVGCSDGTLIRYSIRENDTSSGDPYTIASIQTVPGGKSVDKMTLIPAINKALVLSGGTIHFYTLPAFDPLPGSVISPLRAVITFAVDETAVQPSVAATPGQAVPLVRLCVIRRRAVVVYALRERLAPVKDIPFTHGATRVKLSGPHLCIATATSYWIVNVDASEALELMDWSQPPEPDPSVRPSIAVSDQNEFMLVVWTGTGSLGFFMSGSGDPVRGTLEYPGQPISICVDYPYIAALLPNNTIEIHSMNTMAIVAVLQCPTTLQASFLSHSLSGYLAPSMERNSVLRPVMVPLFRPTPTSPPSPMRRKRESVAPPAGSGLTPPSSPGPVPSSSRSSTGKAIPTTRSRTLVSGPRGIHALLPSTLVSQVDSLLESARIDDAIALVEEAKATAEKPETARDEGFIRELHFIQQKIGFQLLFHTRFQEAGEHFLQGEADPRLLIRLFPELRGKMLSPSDEISVFSGIADDVQKVDSVDAIVMANLVRNYHPHIEPSVEEATPTAELRRVLNVTARDMLLSYLKKLQGRVPSCVEDGAEASKVKRIMATALVKLYAEEHEIRELIALVETSDDIISSDAEPVLIQKRQYACVAKLYERRKDEGKLLEIFSKVVDGDWADPLLPNPLPRVIDILNNCKDRILVQRYGIWLVKHDPAAGLKLFIAKRGMKFDDALILRGIRAVDANLGEKYLEHLVLSRRNSEPALHTQLVNNYLDRMIASLDDPIVVDVWQTALATYTSRPSTSSPVLGSTHPQPFLVHLASSPTSEHLQTRIKLALFLQGSTGYDVPQVLERLEKEDEDGLFAFEKAIVHGKLGNHEPALTLLVRTIRDPTTAEAYCTLGGEVIPSKVAIAVSSKMELEPWGQLVASGGVTGSTILSAGRKTSVNGSTGGKGKVPVTEEKKKELLGILMKVYMKGGDDTAQETASLLNAQAKNLDVLDVLSSVPPAWSLNVISSFLSSSFRRTLHEHHEGQIIKAISSGQNLQVSDAAYEAFREEGAMVEEPLDDGTTTTNTTADEEVLIEKQAFSPVAPAEIPADRGSPRTKGVDLEGSHSGSTPPSSKPLPIPPNDADGDGADGGLPIASPDSSRTPP